MMAGTFAGLAIVGALLLRLPVSHAGQPVGFVDALFTSTSAVCVTGLITVDTATRYSRFGQTVILILIQLGGLGIMTFAAVGAQVFHRRLSFSSHLAWQSAFFEPDFRVDLRRALRQILALTVVFETIGAVLLYLWLPRNVPPAGGWFEATFHAVSAFCNAGFSVYSDNAVAFRDSTLALCTLMALIFVGGIGYTVLIEAVSRAWRWLRRQRTGAVVWTLHSRVVFKVSVGLVLGGALLLMLTGLTPTEKRWTEKAFHALFQSVSARTAGFNTLDIGRLPLPSMLVLIGLIFIGGSPGSCAGGIKTTTATVWFARVRARLTGREDVVVGQRRLPFDTVQRATLVLSLAVIWNAAGVFVLAMSEGHSGVRLEQLVFEQISAFATCGLSANPGASVSLSGAFTVLGKLWVTVTMLVGRVGPLTLAIAVIPTPRKLFEYPSERVMIG